MVSKIQTEETLPLTKMEQSKLQMAAHQHILVDVVDEHFREQDLGAAVSGMESPSEDKHHLKMPGSKQNR